VPGGWVSLEAANGEVKTVLKKPDECCYECRVKVSGDRKIIRIFTTIGPGRTTKAIFLDSDGNIVAEAIGSNIEDAKEKAEAAQRSLNI
jgi:hypothetical protein